MEVLIMARKAKTTAPATTPEVKAGAPKATKKVTVKKTTAKKAVAKKATTAQKATPKASTKASVDVAALKAENKALAAKVKKLEATLVKVKKALA